MSDSRKVSSPDPESPQLGPEADLWFSPQAGKEEKGEEYSALSSLPFTCSLLLGAGIFQICKTQDWLICLVLITREPLRGQKAPFSLSDSGLCPSGSDLDKACLWWVQAGLCSLTSTFSQPVPGGQSRLVSFFVMSAFFGPVAILQPSSTVTEAKSLIHIWFIWFTWVLCWRRRS